MSSSSDMISTKTGYLLKEAGLNWIPREEDRFSIPVIGMEKEHFVISRMAVQVETINGRQMITFNGASEWAMDYITIAEAIWLPSDAQLCAEIQARLVHPYQEKLLLEMTGKSYKGVIFQGEQELVFASTSLSELYAQILILLLRNSNSK